MSVSAWQKTKGYSKKGFDKAWNTLDKIGTPVNRLSNKLGAEAFWPTTLDIECDKSARILRSFCKDGFYEEVDSQGDDEPHEQDQSVPKGKQRVLKKIPASVIKQAKGLAIFTTMRTGLWISGSGGSGVLLARVEETGEWSPPSGIMLHTSGLGFLVGVDIYDCVLVINTYEALEAFKSIRCTLGGELSGAVGPVGVGGVLETEVHKRQAPIWTYLKSKGFYAGIQINGTVVIERSDENERFYHERIPVGDILAGKVIRPPPSINTLMRTIKAAQGDLDVDDSDLPSPGLTPGDVDVHLAGTFGIPDEEDTDPYGVRALEKQGVMIREAGSKRIPTPEMFDFRPSETSPIYSSFRHSTDASRRSSWRDSIQSMLSFSKGTQTDNKHHERTERTGSTTPTSRGSSRSVKDFPLGLQDQTIQETTAAEPAAEPSTEPDTEPATEPKESPSEELPSIETATESVIETHKANAAQMDTHKAVAVSDQSIPNQGPSASPSFTRARLVTIPKRVPPALPQRNPERVSSPLSGLTEARNTGLLSTTPEDESDKESSKDSGKEFTDDSRKESDRWPEEVPELSELSEVSDKESSGKESGQVSEQPSPSPAELNSPHNQLSNWSEQWQSPSPEGDKGKRAPGLNSPDLSPKALAGAFPTDS